MQRENEASGSKSNKNASARRALTSRVTGKPAFWLVRVDPLVGHDNERSNGMLNTDDLRYYTKVGTGYSEYRMMTDAADEIDRLRDGLRRIVMLYESEFDDGETHRPSWVDSLLPPNQS